MSASSGHALPTDRVWDRPELDHVRHGYAPEVSARIAPPSGGDDVGRAEESEPPMADQVETLSDIAARLVDEARTTVEAEVDVLSARAALLADAAKRTSIWAIVAAVGLCFGLIALIVGLLLALTPLVGPWLATVIVTMPLMLVFVLGALMARTALRDIGAALDRADRSRPTEVSSHV